ncbi:MAG: N-acetylmuramoyl-L-alanine amidase [Deltaproteobacteria bacterium]|nr:N-acetylmuramoyl-L-alanine amidase [Deltaproteobacteria bacterium]
MDWSIIGQSLRNLNWSAMGFNVISYNRATAKELGWTPSWFGCSRFDFDLIRSIKTWQRSHGLKADGMVGPGTYERVLRKRRANGLNTSGGISKEVLYNRASEVKLGWKPSWFGGSRNDETLVEHVKTWQRKVGLAADGMVGYTSYRRIHAEREAAAPVATIVRVRERDSRSIIYNGVAFPIQWKKVVLWNEQGGHVCKPGTFRSRAGRARRPIRCFVNHWDATTSARACARALEDRGLSVHFCLDNDGTIYQLVDMQHIAWHARGLNTWSVGVEISDAYYLKYQHYYERHGFGKRPTWHNQEVHKRPMKDFLGFYPAQLEALKALWHAVHVAAGIPLEVPTNEDGKAITGLDRRVIDKEFRGFVCHYHLNPDKIDCAGLDLVTIRDDVRNM